MCWPWGQVAAEDCLDGQQSGRDGVICVSLCLSVHPFTFLPIHPSIHHLFISPPINLPFIHPTIQSPTIHLTHSSIVLCASTRYLLPPQTQSASLRCCHLIHPSIRPYTHPPTHPSTHTSICCSLSTYHVLSPTFQPTHFLRCGVYSLLPVGWGECVWALPTPLAGPCQTASPLIMTSAVDPHPLGEGRS